MKSILEFLQFRILQRSPDLALLILRVWAGLMLFTLHGWSKFTNFGAMSDRFADPFGLGPTFSLVLATLGETVCPLLVAVGFATRLGALGAGGVMVTAFVTAHGANLQGPGNGELPFLFLAVFVAIFIAGPGKFSIDRKFGGA
jgi:putative oxidoreductase